jgi:hypothetical protein
VRGIPAILLQIKKKLNVHLYVTVEGSVLGR